MPRIFWPLLSAMLAAWLALNLWTVPKIEAMSGGLRLLDMRITGYPFAQAQDFNWRRGCRVISRAATLARHHPLLGAFICYRWVFPGWLGLN